MANPLFRREDLAPPEKLSEAQAECKKLCDAVNSCKYAYLETKGTAPAVKWCNGFTSSCSVMDGVAGQQVYTKGKYYDLKYILFGT